MKPYETGNAWQTYHWQSPPAPFNPAFNPLAKSWGDKAAASMKADGFYDTHTREDCKAEYARRYDLNKAESVGLA